jgi:regulatory protein
LNDSENPVSSAAYPRAINLLARRDHTTAEIKHKLAIRGFPADVIADVIEKLTQQGLLDDRRFAERWVESALLSGRGYGIRLLQELQRKGVPREIAAEAVAAASAEHSEQNSLAAIMSRRFAAFAPEGASLKEKQRIYSYLQRRGFSIQSINSFFINQDRGV